MLCIERHMILCTDHRLPGSSGIIIGDGKRITRRGYHGGVASVGRAHHIATIFHRTQPRHLIVLEMAWAVAPPRVIGDDRQQLGSVFDKFTDQVAIDGLIADSRSYLQWLSIHLDGEDFLGCISAQSAVIASQLDHQVGQETKHMPVRESLRTGNQPAFVVMAIIAIFVKTHG